MADPKAVLEAQIYGVLDTALTESVFNGSVMSDGFDYVIITPAGGTDEHHRLRGYDYEYQITAISLSRATALSMSEGVDTAIEGASLTVAGHDVPWAERVTSVDYPEFRPDGLVLWHIGGIYLFHVRESN